MHSTLTLQLDEQLIRTAQDYAEQHGQSLAQLVAEFFARLDKPHEAPPRQLPPITRSLFGIMRGGRIDEQDYRTYLEES